MSVQQFSDNLSTLSYIPKRRVPLWLYDGKNHSIIGRTPLRWLLLLIFYIIYYSGLSLFFMVLLWSYMKINIPRNLPHRTGDESLIKLKAGLSFRPILEVKKTSLKFSTSDPQEYLPYTQNIDTFLELYKTVNNKPDGQFDDCTSKDRNIDKICKYPLDLLGPCNTKNSYGYPSGTPCLIFKINKVYGWLPNITDPTLTNNALLNCTGQEKADVENMGELAYYPSVNVEGKSYGKFDSNYFPYIGQSSYLSPVVAVQFKSPKKRVAMLVECTLNNLYNANKNSVRFELLVD